MVSSFSFFLFLNLIVVFGIMLDRVKDVLDTSGLMSAKCQDTLFVKQQIGIFFLWKGNPIQCIHVGTCFQTKSV